MNKETEDQRFDELQQADSKLLVSAKQIDRNVIYQILIIFIGVAFCARPEILIESDLPFAKGRSLIPYIVSPLLTYFFMRFGFSFYHYYTLRYNLDEKIKEAYSYFNREKWHYRIFTNASIAESIYIFFKRRDPSFDEIEDAYALKKRKLPFSMIVASIYMLILSLNHAITMYFVIKFPEDQYWKIGLTAIFAIIITVCYIDYYSMKRVFHKVGIVWLLIYLIAIGSLFIMMKYFPEFSTTSVTPISNCDTIVTA